MLIYLEWGWGYGSGDEFWCHMSVWICEYKGTGDVSLGSAAIGNTKVSVLFHCKLLPLISIVISNTKEISPVLKLWVYTVQLIILWGTFYFWIYPFVFNRIEIGSLELS